MDRARAAPRDSMRDDASRGVVGRLVDADAAAGGRDAAAGAVVPLPRAFLCRRAKSVTLVPPLGTGSASSEGRSERIVSVAT